ncbi:MAG: hypothetical protein IID37_12165 [Planctomycetes bacterium]|nr:hypothetical protein [Planctomycetota bacterium]
MTIRSLALTLSCLGALASPAVAGFQLTDSDRVVFYGDRMTKLPEIGQFVEQFVRIRYPRLETRFWHAAPRGRATAKSALGEFDAVVPELAPTVVVLSFGSSDPAGRPFDQVRYDEFLAAMSDLTDRCLALGASVYLLTPPRPEIQHKKLYTGTKYDATVRRYSDGLLELAKQKGALVIDWNAAMTEYVAGGGGQNPKQPFMGKTGITPSDEAIAVAVDLFLSQWQAEPIEATIRVNWTSPEIETSGCTARASHPSDNSLLLELYGVPIPWAVKGRHNPFKAEWPVRRFCRLILTVDNAPDGKLALNVARDKANFNVDGERLRSGYDLASGSPLFDAEETVRLATVIGQKNNAHNRLMAFDRDSAKKPKPEPELAHAYQLHRQMWHEYNRGWSEVVNRTSRKVDITIHIKRIGGK